MIKKEIKRIIQMEKYLQDLTPSQVQNNLLKQDFYIFGREQQKRPSLFQENQGPEERIFRLLVQEQQTGSYQQLQQIQFLIDRLQQKQWNYEPVAELRNRYLEQRKEIVESGLTVKQVIEFCKSDTKTINQGCPFGALIKAYHGQKQLKNEFLWEFIDKVFNLFQKNPFINQNQTNKLSNNTQYEYNEQTYQKINNIEDMYKKLLLLVQPTAQQQVQKENQMRISINKGRNKSKSMINDHGRKF